MCLGEPANSGWLVKYLNFAKRHDRHQHPSRMLPNSSIPYIFPLPLSFPGFTVASPFVFLLCYFLPTAQFFAAHSDGTDVGVTI
jgi:hypothetical protein